MKKKTNKKTDNPEQIHKGKQLTLDRAKLIVSYYIANNCANKTEALIKAGYSSKTATYNSTRIFRDSRIQDELKRQITPVIATGQITAINLQSKYMQMVDEILDGKMYRLYAVAKSCLDSLNKTIGGFQADRLPAENLAAKLLETKKAEELNKALNAYYSSKYLAGNPDVITVESICKDTDNPDLTSALQSDSPDITPDKTTDTELPETDPVTPHAPPASSTTSLSLTCDDFSENGEAKIEDGDISDIMIKR
jgi:hypothetical protein